MNEPRIYKCMSMETFNNMESMVWLLKISMDACVCVCVTVFEFLENRLGF